MVRMQRSQTQVILAQAKVQLLLGEVSYDLQSLFDLGVSPQIYALCAQEVTNLRARGSARRTTTVARDSVEDNVAHHTCCDSICNVENGPCSSTYLGGVVHLNCPHCFLYGRLPFAKINLPCFDEQE